MTVNEIIKYLVSILDTMRAYDSSQAPIGKGLVEDIISMYDSQKAEVEELQHKISELQHENLNCKSEAIREFAEELVDEKFSNYDKTDDILVYDIQGRIYEFAESYINKTVGDEDA